MCLSISYSRIFIYVFTSILNTDINIDSVLYIRC